jgi:SAM-dependent methyltransferase
VLWAYYTLLFGRRFPHALRLEGWLSAWEARSGRGDVPQPHEAWEAQYRGGRWDCLGRADEAARYGVIAGLLAHQRPRCVLDVGCGEGLLLDHFRPREGGSYLGIDLSAAAIEAAGRRGDDRARCVVADAEAFAPEERLDAVVLNECLYYFRDPLGQAERYHGLLRQGGILIVSMFRSPRTRALLRALKARLPPAEELELRHPKGRWYVAVFRRGNAPPGPGAAAPSGAGS